MKNFLKIICLGLLFGSFVTNENAFARTGRKSNRARHSGGSCTSSCGGGCDTTKIRENKDWLSFYGTAAGSKAISCFRPQHCQDELVASCAPGRAARVSNHTMMIAMDFHESDRVAAINAAKGKIANFRVLNHGGTGTHLSNGSREGSGYGGLNAPAREYKKNRKPRRRKR